MATFTDLTPYTYHKHSCRPGTVNVGWLGRDLPFPIAQPDEAFLAKLWNYCCNPVIQHRGHHTCELCSTNEHHTTTVTIAGKTYGLGSAEIRVFGEGTVIYASPDMICHYVSAHNYCPPVEFVEAVLASSPPGSDEYARRLSALGFNIFEHGPWLIAEDNTSPRSNGGDT